MQEKWNKNILNVKLFLLEKIFQKGNYMEPFLSDDFITNRCNVHGVDREDYTNKLSPIINLNFDKEYVLCFGEDDYCKANLNFMINYLRINNYKYRIRIKILNEDTLELIKEYMI